MGFARPEARRETGATGGAALRPPDTSAVAGCGWRVGGEIESRDPASTGFPLCILVLAAGASSSNVDGVPEEIVCGLTQDL